MGSGTSRICCNSQMSDEPGERLSCLSKKLFVMMRKIGFCLLLRNQDKLFFIYTSVYVFCEKAHWTVPPIFAQRPLRSVSLQGRRPEEWKCVRPRWRIVLSVQIHSCNVILGQITVHRVHLSSLTVHTYLYHKGARKRFKACFHMRACQEGSFRTLSRSFSLISHG